jgi:hypothetical protein
MWQYLHQKLPFTIAIVNGLLTGLLVLFYERKQSGFLYLTLGVILVLITIEIIAVYDIGSRVTLPHVSWRYSTPVASILSFSLALLFSFFAIYLVQKFVLLFQIRFESESVVSYQGESSHTTTTWRLNPISVLLTITGFLTWYFLPLVLANFGAWLGIRAVFGQHRVVSFGHVITGFLFSAQVFPVFACSFLTIWTMGQWMIFDSVLFDSNQIWGIAVTLLAVGSQFHLFNKTRQSIG